MVATTPTTTDKSKATVPLDHAIIYDPDREGLKPIAGTRAVRTLGICYIASKQQQMTYTGHQQVLTAINEVYFLPGFNVIKGEEWEKIKDNPHVKWRLDRGAFIFLRPREKDQPIDNCSDIHDEDVIAALDNTWDPELLENWARMEDRRWARDHIVKRIKSITTRDS